VQNGCGRADDSCISIDGSSRADSDGRLSDSGATVQGCATVRLPSKFLLGSAARQVRRRRKFPCCATIRMPVRTRRCLLTGGNRNNSVGTGRWRRAEYSSGASESMFAYLMPKTMTSGMSSTPHVALALHLQASGTDLRLPVNHHARDSLGHHEDSLGNRASRNRDRQHCYEYWRGQLDRMPGSVDDTCSIRSQRCWLGRWLRAQSVIED
jgi:hypothetical protein